jgi:hypothetical protein
MRALFATRTVTIIIVVSRVPVSNSAGVWTRHTGNGGQCAQCKDEEHFFHGFLEAIQVEGSESMRFA